MAEITQPLDKAIQYFKPEALLRRPPATAESLAATEEALGLKLPPSVRALLEIHDGLSVDGKGLLGTAPAGSDEGIVAETLHYREVFHRTDLLLVGRSNTGDGYALLLNEANPAGEHPVAQIDHEDGHGMFLLGSNYERFVWFLLDRLQREYRPDGRYKHDGDASFPWPLDNRKWMVQQDPDLAAYFEKRGDKMTGSDRAWWQFWR